MRTLRFKHIPPIGCRRIPARGTLLDLVRAIPCLAPGYIPPRGVLNNVLRRGRMDAGMSGGAIWRPFAISQDEYDELVSPWIASERQTRGLELKLPTDVPRGIRTCEAFCSWVSAQAGHPTTVERPRKSRKPRRRMKRGDRKKYFAQVASEESDPVRKAIWVNDLRSLARLLHDMPKKPRSAYDGYVWLAAKEGRARLVRMLIEHGARTTIISPVGYPETLPLLDDCLILRHPSVVRVLLAAGADPNGGRKDYGTPLREALERGFGRIARLLLEAGADPNACDKHWRRGMTPFLCAVAPVFCSDGERKIIATLRLLLKYDARPDAITASGATALEIARTYELRRVAAFLRRLARARPRNAKPSPR